jgi:hypothetical protein
MATAVTAQTTDTLHTPTIRPGSIELGMAGSLTAVEGLARVALMLRIGTFVATGPITLGGEVEAGYSHTNALGAVDLQGAIAITGSAGEGVVWPYIAAAGGIRQEWLGSFSELRIPIGGDVGLRLLLSDGAAIRIGYRYRRVLNDPVSAYTEHQIVLGISLLLGNRPAARVSE